MRAATTPMTIDGLPVSVPAGTNVMRAAESIGIKIPRFCDHPLLDPVAACRQCMVEVPDGGNGRAMKPQPACALTSAPGMVVATGLTSPLARAAQEGMLELLLSRHPLDCPVCDQAGECPLQQQAMSAGSGRSRYDGQRRNLPKPIPVTSSLLLDRERCVLCQRCTRFGDQISGDQLLSLVERGADSQVCPGPETSNGAGSYFSGNLAQICPVGAITTTDYRFQARPTDLVSTITTCDACAAGCALQVDQRAGQVRRRQAANDPSCNEEWICDKGRFASRQTERLTKPLLRGADGKQVEVSWPQALTAAAAGLGSLAGRVGVLPGGRLTMENALAYARFSRLVLGSNAIDARTRRAATPEEANFILRQQLGAAGGVSYADLESSRQVVLVALEPEDECPMIFLRLRKAVHRRTCQVTTLAPWASAGSRKLSANLIAVAPGQEATGLSRLKLKAGAIILVGERAAAVPGLLTAVERLSTSSGARLVWVPRRTGELGATAIGCLPGWESPAVRAALAAAWGVAALPDGQGWTADQIWTGAAQGQIGLLVGGVDIDDLDDPSIAQAGLTGAPFVVSLEQRPSAVTAMANVVLPVASLAEQAGTFLDWTGSQRPVKPVLKPQPLTDRRILNDLARRLGRDLGLSSHQAARHFVEQTLAIQLAFAPATGQTSASPPPAAAPQLATWRSLLVGSKSLAGATSLVPRPAVVVTGADLARQLHLQPGSQVVVTGPNGLSLMAPLVIDATIAPGVVWLADAPWPAGVTVQLRPGGGQ